MPWPETACNLPRPARNIGVEGIGAPMSRAGPMRNRARLRPKPLRSPSPRSTQGKAH